MQFLKQFIAHPVVVLLLRLVLGSVFIISGLDKVADLNTFMHAILNYQIIDSGIAAVVATVLPWLEILCGLGVILGIYPRASSVIITLLLAVFTLLVGTAMLRGLDISCGCFTQDPSAHRVGWQKIAENIGMMLAGIYLASARNWKFILEHSTLISNHS